MVEIDISDEEVAFFKANGYLSIDRITTDQELEWLGEIYDRLFRERTGEAKGLFFDLAGPRGHEGAESLPQVLGPDLTFPELRESLYFRNAKRLAAQLLEVDELARTGGHMILKPARHGAKTPWHQDEAYWDPAERPQSLSVWMPLDPATVESGGMQFIPRSQRGEVRWHRHIDDNPLIHGLVTDDVDETRAVACPVPAGGATFHHCRTLHYAGPNTTDRVRRAYVIICTASSEKSAVPADRPWQADERNAVANAGIDVDVF